MGRLKASKYLHSESKDQASEWWAGLALPFVWKTTTRVGLWNVPSTAAQGPLNRKGRKRMPSMDDVYGGDYLKAEDLPEHARVLVRVESVAVVEIGKEGEEKQKKLAVRFVGKEKLLLLNVTNANMLAEIAQSRDYDTWPGKHALLYRTMVDFAGKRVPALRLDHYAPTPSSAIPPKPAPPVWKPAAPISRPPAEAFVSTDEDVPF